MDVHANLRNLRMSPRKVRLVIDLIRRQPVAEAETRLRFAKKLAARPVLKLLNSAVANAEHNFKLPKDGLWIKTITADGGPTLKRFMPRAMGRATPIRERTTHIQIVLSNDAKDGKSTVKAAAKPVEPKTEPKPKATRKPKAAAKPAKTNA